MGRVRRAVAHDRGECAVRVIVDLTRCQGYGQCAFLAPDVFAMNGEEALLYDTDADEAQREHVLRAAAACPVQAIHLDQMATQHRGMRTGTVVSPPVGDWFRKTGRIVIVGASLAGARAAGVLRRDGFTGSLTLIGDEPYEPYDRPPLSKQVLTGRVPADHTLLPRLREVDAEWLPGVAASGLDLAAKTVRLADGREIGFDRLLIATGARARPWPNPEEAALDGVLPLRTIEESSRLRERLAARPRRVLVIGAGFTGSEVASVCRDLDLPVTVAERGPAPLIGALGGVIGKVAAEMQRAHGVDLRCGVTVEALEGDADGRLRAARLSDGDTVEADVAVVALGAIRNVEWLRDSGLAAGVWGVACDAGCRAVDINGLVTDDVFVAGDVARFPHPVYNYQFMTLEHWGNAVAQAEIAAHNMLSDQAHRWPHLSLPVFWSNQFGTSIKSVGVPTFADEVVIAHGSTEERRFVAVYGYRGRVTAAVTFDRAMWLEFYQDLIERAAPFPPEFRAADRPETLRPVPAEIPERLEATQVTVVVTGHDPAERRATLVHR
ncbi:FAD-dependent oxidoreductase [Actinoallomurus sp. CA-150999]|uniref:FAD-dependent oxidoreductase n=1 Tax=Actinoallomurus sp. CA-150999 TaxID=3239887 RepID=UPI003D8C9E70